MADIFDKCDEFWARMTKIAGEEHMVALRNTFFRKFPITNCTPNINNFTLARNTTIDPSAVYN
ncbi:MAG: hypothetical protein ACK52A_05840, partial [Planctomycetota bacterium]